MMKSGFKRGANLLIIMLILISLIPVGVLAEGVNDLDGATISPETLSTNNLETATSGAEGLTSNEAVQEIEVNQITETAPILETNAIENGFEYTNYNDGYDDGVSIIRYTYPDNNTEIEIPSYLGNKKVTKIDKYAFGANKKSQTIKSIMIPEFVSVIGVSPFAACSELTEIIVDDNNLNFSSSEGILYNKDKSTLRYCPPGLSKVAIPSSVTSIEEYAFDNCQKLLSVVIPESVTNISDRAFKDCQKLTQVIIPKGVASIGTGCFFCCWSLNSVTFESATTTIKDDPATVYDKAIITGFKGSTAESYAKKYGRTFIIANYTLLMPKDTNKFKHNEENFFDANKNGAYLLPKRLYYKLVAEQPNDIKAKVLDKMNGTWSGSCFGISTTMGLLKTGAVDIKNVDPTASNYSDLDPIKNDTAKDMIQYYHLSQFLPNVMSEKITFNESGSRDKLETTLENIVEKSKAIKEGDKPLLFFFSLPYGTRSYSHTVVINGCVENSDGDYEVQIVDCNDQGGYNYLTIDKDHTWFKYVNSAIELNEKNYRFIGYQELNTFDSIDIDNNGVIIAGLDGTGTQAVEDDWKGTRVCIGDAMLTMYSEDNKSLSLTENGISGEIVPRSIRPIVASTEDGNSSCNYLMNLEEAGAFRFEPVEGNIDVSVGDNERYAAVEAAGVSDVEFATGNNININGSGSSYSAYVSDPGDEEGLIRISDNNSSNTKIEEVAGGVVVRNDNNIDSLQVEIIKPSGGVVQELTISTDNKEVLIKDKPNDNTGAAQLFISDKNDGNFNLVIGETTTPTPLNAITLNKEKITLNKGDTETLIVNDPANFIEDKAITWTSSDPTIASVDASGKVTAKKTGESTITAMVGSLKAECKVTVKGSNDDASCTYQTHVQNVGWQGWKKNGEMSGTEGMSYRLEGIKIQTGIENLGVTYQTHIQNIGWEGNSGRGWKKDGGMSGTEGLSYRLEAIEIKLTGSEANNYDIWYQVHAQNIGWMGWAKNGERSGTAGYSYRLEGIKIIVLPKGSTAPGSTVNAFKEYGIQ